MVHLRPVLFESSRTNTERGGVRLFGLTYLANVDVSSDPTACKVTKDRLQMGLDMGRLGSGSKRPFRSVLGPFYPSLSLRRVLFLIYKSRRYRDQLVSAKSSRSLRNPGRARRYGQTPSTDSKRGNGWGFVEEVLRTGNPSHRSRNGVDNNTGLVTRNPT